jgi:hypothetical protein
MKYIVGIILVVLLIRIDFILGLFDSVRERVSTPAASVLDDDSASSKPKTIPMDKDRAVNTSSRDNFLNVLALFSKNPDESYRLKAFEILRENPDILGNKSDTEFNQTIFSWRDLIERENNELIQFLNDLLMVLSGESRMTVVSFYSLILDEKPEFFVKSLSYEADKTCTIARHFSDKMSLAEKMVILKYRYAFLERIFLSEDFSPAEKRIANSCIESVRLEQEKLMPSEKGAEEAPLESTP